MFIGDYNFLRQVTVCARNVTLFAIVTHRLLAIYFTVCTRSIQDIEGAIRSASAINSVSMAGLPAGMATMTEFQLAAGYLFAGMEVRGRGAGSQTSSE